ncbi:NADP-dependent oxidoreductase domain-containing protein [Mycena maculata]|uniref:NADP-dependent oxidoreductase domain-containing protein n=1 Tax=Mycena maculata TaxID=230809 RepID=A0AAD7HYZ9_9AGAR|nr:NADP-dependent oxidoreductase domain-containing protein [Mycena maculata]
MSFGKTLTLSGGSTVPQIALGTWLAEPGEVGKAVELAVRTGYRALDLATIYENQVEVGAALKKVIPSVVKREDLFLTSKCWNSAHRPAEVEKDLDRALEDLGVDYLDLYLIHWPVAFVPGKGLYPPHPTKEGEVELDLETSLVDTWKAMIALPKSKVRNVGVSNFTIEQLEGIISVTNVVPTVNQIEAHPLLQQDNLFAYCKNMNIQIIAYSPLGNNLIGEQKLTDHPVVIDIAARLSATPAQVLIAWGVYRGYTVNVKSVQERRIISNFTQHVLSEMDYEKLTALGQGRHVRFNIPYRYSPGWDISIFDEPAEAKATHKVKIV